MADPTKVQAYENGEVELYHPELNATMEVPESSVEAWKSSGWVTKRSKAARDATGKEE